MGVSLTYVFHTLQAAAILHFPKEPNNGTETLMLGKDDQILQIQALHCHD